MFGNPFPINVYGPDAIGMHAAWLAGHGQDQIRHGRRVYDRTVVLGRLASLANYEYLSCFCPVCQPCHVDTLLFMLGGIDNATTT